jgi:hypothetical protein
MVRLVVLGAHSRLESELCARCPQGSAGCCAGPPDLDWSDIGRVVHRDPQARDWLLEEIAAQRLIQAPNGLRIKRVKRRDSTREPRIAKCVYHGAQGCTIPHDRRAATCNYFLCDTALQLRLETESKSEAAEKEAQARALHASLCATYEGWDQLIEARLRGRLVGEGLEAPLLNAALLDWLGALVRELEASSVFKIR